jgi:hypothetical protein
VRGVTKMKSWLVVGAIAALSVGVQGASGMHLESVSAQQAPPIAEPPPSAGQPAPHSNPGGDPCLGQYASSPKRLREPGNYNLPFCGSTGNDNMKSKKGHSWIDGADGKDVIRAQGNGKADRIWGGGGYDTAYIDAFDTAVKVEKVIVARRPASNAAPRAVGPQFTYLPAAFQCQVRSEGQRDIVFSAQPTIRAVDSTPRTDWQPVAWSALLYEWDGTKWAPSSNAHVYEWTGSAWELLNNPERPYQTLWRWDHSRDTQFDSLIQFPGNYWRRFDNRLRATAWFVATRAGSFRVAIRYYWYATATTEVHEEFQWGGPHSGPYTDPYAQQRYCYFPS